MAYFQKLRTQNIINFASGSARTLVDRVMEGAAVTTGQLMPEGLFGYTSALKTEPYDVEGAKKLLAEAGYPNGFEAALKLPPVG